MVATRCHCKIIKIDGASNQCDSNHHHQMGNIFHNPTKRCRQQLPLSELFIIFTHQNICSFTLLCEGTWSQLKHTRIIRQKMPLINSPSGSLIIHSHRDLECERTINTGTAAEQQKFKGNIIDKRTGSNKLSFFDIFSILRSFAVACCVAYIYSGSESRRREKLPLFLVRFVAEADTHLTLVAIKSNGINQSGIFARESGCLLHLLLSVGRGFPWQRHRRDKCSKLRVAKYRRTNKRTLKFQFYCSIQLKRFSNVAQNLPWRRSGT
jgi:hypothetical protein